MTVEHGVLFDLVRGQAFLAPVVTAQEIIEGVADLPEALVRQRRYLTTHAQMVVVLLPGLVHKPIRFEGEEGPVHKTPGGRSSSGASTRLPWAGARHRTEW